MTLRDDTVATTKARATGPHYRVYAPGTWPPQAGLVADGRWSQFTRVTHSRKVGR